MTILIAAVILAFVAASWVAYPMLYRRWGLLGDTAATDVLDRESRKRVALAALKDVEYDHAAGKLDERDYHEIRGQLESEALEAIRAADRAALSGDSKAHVCGFSNPAGSRFCAGCGQRLT